MKNRIETLSRTLDLEYTILCEDVRVEVGNKLTLVGIFSGIYIPQIPVTIIKFAVLNHFRGEGTYLTEVRILSPDRTQAVVASRPTSFQIQLNGYADNVNLFANVTFPVAGDYVVQTLVDSNLFSERILPVGMVTPEGSDVDMISQRIN